MMRDFLLGSVWTALVVVKFEHALSGPLTFSMAATIWAAVPVFLAVRSRRPARR